MVALVTEEESECVYQAEDADAAVHMLSQPSRRRPLADVEPFVISAGAGRRVGSFRSIASSGTRNTSDIDDRSCSNGHYTDAINSYMYTTIQHEHALALCLHAL